MFSEQDTYAPFWVRWFAMSIDGLIMLIPGIILSTLTFFVFGAGGWIGTWLYFAFQEASPGRATLGKKAMGIAVTQTNGEPIEFGRATGRYFAKILSALSLIGYFLPFFDRQNKALHDMLANTVVIKVSAPQTWAILLGGFLVGVEIVALIAFSGSIITLITALSSSSY